MKRSLLLVFTMTALAFLTVPAKEGQKRMWHGERLKEKIGLTDEQIRKIEGIKIEVEKVVEKHKYALKTERLTIREMAVKGTITKEKIKEILKKTKSEREKIHQAQYKGILKVIDVFTEEQIKKMAEKKMLNRFFYFHDRKGSHEKRMKHMKHKKQMMNK